MDVGVQSRRNWKQSERSLGYYMCNFVYFFFQLPHDIKTRPTFSRWICDSQRVLATIWWRFHVARQFLESFGFSSQWIISISRSVMRASYERQFICSILSFEGTDKEVCRLKLYQPTSSRNNITIYMQNLFKRIRGFKMGRESFHFLSFFLEVPPRFRIWPGRWNPILAFGRIGSKSWLSRWPRLRPRLGFLPFIEDANKMSTCRTFKLRLPAFVKQSA